MTAETPDSPAALANTQTPEQIVVDFFTAIWRNDIDAALEFIHPDIEWFNVGLPTIRGKKRVSKALHGLGGKLIVEFVNISAEGNTVLTERIDETAFGRVHWQFWACGRFEIKDGRIILWRDYFDHLRLVLTLFRALVAAVIPAAQRNLAPPA